jgi:hypothetical protein
MQYMPHSSFGNIRCLGVLLMAVIAHFQRCFERIFRLQVTGSSKAVAYIWRCFWNPGRVHSATSSPYKSYRRTKIPTASMNIKRRFFPTSSTRYPQSHFISLNYCEMPKGTHSVNFHVPASDRQRCQRAGRASWAGLCCLGNCSFMMNAMNAQILQS